SDKDLTAYANKLETSLKSSQKWSCVWGSLPGIKTEVANIIDYFVKEQLVEPMAPTPLSQNTQNATEIQVQNQNQNQNQNTQENLTKTEELTVFTEQGSMLYKKSSLAAYHYVDDLLLGK